MFSFKDRGFRVAKKQLVRSSAIFAVLGMSLLMSPSVLFAQSSLEDQILSGEFQDGTSSAAPSKSSNDTPPVVEYNEPPSSENSSSGEDLIESNMPKVDEDDLEAVDEAVIGPKNIPKSHILVVQHQTIDKAHRHEIMPFSLGLQPADSFRRQFQWGFGYTYHFNEYIAVEAVHLGFMFNYSGKLEDTIFENTGLRTNREEPVMVAGSALLWTPLRSKAAMGEDVYYFEGYFIAGGGATRFESGFSPMAMAGVGFRAYVSERTLVKLEVRDYIDFKDGSDQRVNVLMGAALLWGNGR